MLPRKDQHPRESSNKQNHYIPRDLYEGVDLERHPQKRSSQQPQPDSELYDDIEPFQGLGAAKDRQGRLNTH